MHRAVTGSGCMPRQLLSGIRSISRIVCAIPSSDEIANVEDWWEEVARSGLLCNLPSTSSFVQISTSVRAPLVKTAVVVLITTRSLNAFVVMDSVETGANLVRRTSMTTIKLSAVAAGLTAQSSKLSLPSSLAKVISQIPGKIEYYSVADRILPAASNGMPVAELYPWLS